MARPKRPILIKQYIDDETSECTKCGRDLPLEVYYTSNGKRQRMCRGCASGVEFHIVLSYRERPKSERDKRLNQVFAKVLDEQFPSAAAH